MLSYQTAWLKAHYPAEFMAALLSSEIGNTDKVVQYINEARELGLEVLPPDVNESGFKFTVVGDRRIRFGLGAVRNVGWGAIESIIAARQRCCPFTTLVDLVERIDLRLCNKRVLESLVAAGACDSLGGHRAQLCAALDAVLGEAQLSQQERDAGQASLFGEAAVADGPARPVLPEVPDWTGGGAPGQGEGSARLLHLRPSRWSGSATRWSSSAPAPPRRWANGASTRSRVAAVVTAVKRQISKKTGKEYARLVLEDFHGTAEAIVFPDAWAKLNQVIRPDAAAAAHRRLQRPGPGRGPGAVRRRIGPAAGRAQGVRGGGAEPPLARPGRAGTRAARRPRRSAAAHPGPTPVYIEWSDGNGESVRLRSRRLRVAAEEDLVRALRDLLGADAVHYVKAG